MLNTKVTYKGSDFKEGGAAANLGFPPSYSSESSYSFFANLCVEIWAFVLNNNVRTFDIDMKKAQLRQLRIPSSVLLVDESQDMDECQVAWIASQKQFGTHIFFVGDSAQCIYGFRGAKSSYVMNLDCIDTELTRSWRFGPTIATVANIPLFAKHHSVQTSGNKKLWRPYRVQGCGKESGKVTTKSLLENWQKEKKQVTLIGMTNAGLLQKALDLLGLGALKHPTNSDSADGSAEEESVYPPVKDEVDNMISLPKIFINGKGENSGRRKYSKATKQIRKLYELYMNRDESGFLPMTLPAKEFRDFVNEGPITWTAFIELYTVKELTKYTMAVSIISTYGENTLKAIDAFERHVMTQKCSEVEADVILTTVHSAKGLEWDHVEVCDDVLDLAA